MYQYDLQQQLELQKPLESSLQEYFLDRFALNIMFKNFDKNQNKLINYTKSFKINLDSLRLFNDFIINITNLYNKDIQNIKNKSFKEIKQEHSNIENLLNQSKDCYISILIEQVLLILDMIYNNKTTKELLQYYKSIILLLLPFNWILQNDPEILEIFIFIKELLDLNIENHMSYKTIQQKVSEYKCFLTKIKFKEFYTDKETINQVPFFKKTIKRLTFCINFIIALKNKYYNIINIIYFISNIHPSLIKNINNLNSFCGNFEAYMYHDNLYKTIKTPEDHNCRFILERIENYNQNNLKDPENLLLNEIEFLDILHKNPKQLTINSFNIDYHEIFTLFKSNYEGKINCNKMKLLVSNQNNPNTLTLNAKICEIFIQQEEVIQVIDKGEYKSLTFFDIYKLLYDDLKSCWILYQQQHYHKKLKDNFTQYIISDQENFFNILNQIKLKFLKYNNQSLSDIQLDTMKQLMKNQEYCDILNNNNIDTHQSYVNKTNNNIDTNKLQINKKIKKVNQNKKKLHIYNPDIDSQQQNLVSTADTNISCYKDSSS